MINTGAAVYGLEYRSRSIASVLGESDRHQFLVGTLNLKGGASHNNHLHLLEYMEESNLIDCIGLWTHGLGEIWHIACCPSRMRKDFFFTSWKKSNGTSGATLWSMGTIDGSNELKQLSTLSLASNRVLWDPSGLSDSVIVLDDTEHTGLTSVNLDSNCTNYSVSSRIGVGNAQRVVAGAWDPNHSDTVCLAADSALVKCDLRSKLKVGTIEQAHHLSIRDVQFNANKIYHLISGGDDGFIRVWDSRRWSIPLMAVEAHDHWVCSVGVNPVHDQLVLTSSSDCSTKLWNLTSGLFASSTDSSSSPSIGGDNEGPLSGGSPNEAGRTKDIHPTVYPRTGDVLLRSIAEYEDSVYGVSWSACTPWIFASVSHNGKVLVHRVPDKTKYGILLGHSDSHNTGSGDDSMMATG